MVLDHLVARGCLFGVLHGAENLPGECGRDVDLFVAPNEVERINREITSVLADGGWEVGTSYKEIGIDQVFAFREVDGKRLWLEFDIIHDHPFCWRGQTLVPIGLEREDLGEDHGYPCYVWGWFAKNLLMQLVAGNEEKFRGNLVEYREKDGFEEKVRERAAEQGLELAISRILNVEAEYDFMSLRDGCRRDLMRSLLHPKRLWSSMLSCVPWAIRTYRLYFPKAGCAPVVHLVGESESEVRKVAESLSERIQDSYPFPNIRMERGVRGKSPTRWFPFRMRAVICGGWERDKRDSNWLTLIIFWWVGSKDDAVSTGEKVTPGDLVIRDVGAPEGEDVKSIFERVKPAFMMNLERHCG